MDLDKVTLEKVVDERQRGGGMYVISRGVDCLEIIYFGPNTEEVAKQKAREFRDGKLKVVRTEIEF